VLRSSNCMGRKCGLQPRILPDAKVAPVLAR
jgi:hypothetical protein